MLAGGGGAERVLVAGCGDVGSRVAGRLLARGVEVCALRRRPPAGDRSGIRWIAADLTRPETLSGLPAVDALVYLPTPGSRGEDAYRAVFLDGLRHVIAGLDRGRLERVVFVSSSAVYGDHGDGWVDETTRPDPPGHNGRVLLEAERWLAAQPVRSVVLRLAGLYGPDRTHPFERLRSGRATVPRAHPHWANRIHVDDAAGAIVHLLGLPEPAGCYLGCDDTPLPLHVLYDHLADLLGIPRPPDGPPPPGIGGKRLSNARLRASGFTPRWPDARDGYAALAGGDRP